MKAAAAVLGENPPFLHRRELANGGIRVRMENRTEPKTVGQWIRYVVVAVIAIWLVIWMLRLSGINVL